MQVIMMSKIVHIYIYTCQIIVLSKSQTNVGWKQLLIKMKTGNISFGVKNDEKKKRDWTVGLLFFF
jgi:hypothetical protein